jgi:hypothetical protein
MEGNFSRVIACTTQDFDGFVANIRPGGFATRFVGLEKSIPGFYALTVRGEIPPEVQLEEELDAEERKRLYDDIPSLAGDSSEEEGEVPPISRDSRAMTASSTTVTPNATPNLMMGEIRSASKSGQKVQKKRRLAHPNVGKPQPGSTASTSSDNSGIGLGNAARKVLGDLLSDSEPGTPQAQPGTPKFVEPRDDKSDARSSKDERQVVASGSEADSLRAPSSRAKESSHGTAASSGTQVSKASVAILEADPDTEFRGAPE